VPAGPSLICPYSRPLPLRSAAGMRGPVSNLTRRARRRRGGSSSASTRPQPPAPPISCASGTSGAGLKR